MTGRVACNVGYHGRTWRPRQVIARGPVRVGDRMTTWVDVDDDVRDPGDCVEDRVANRLSDRVASECRQIAVDDDVGLGLEPVAEPPDPGT